MSDSLWLLWGVRGHSSVHQNWNPDHSVTTSLTYTVLGLRKCILFVSLISFLKKIQCSRELYKGFVSLISPPKIPFFINEKIVGYSASGGQMRKFH